MLLSWGWCLALEVPLAGLELLQGWALLVPAQICSTDTLTLRNPCANETSPGVKHSKADVARREELCSLCLQISLARAGHTQLSLGPRSSWHYQSPKVGTVKQLKAHQMLSKLPPAPQLAKLSWKPCNEIKRCIQMIFWQYLNRCTEEMSALAHMWPVETNQWWWRLADRDLVEKIGVFLAGSFQRSLRTAGRVLTFLPWFHLIISYNSHSLFFGPFSCAHLCFANTSGMSNEFEESKPFQSILDCWFYFSLEWFNLSLSSAHQKVQNFLAEGETWDQCTQYREIFLQEKLNEHL